MSCANGGTCVTNGLYEYQCECAPGWIGDFCEGRQYWIKMKGNRGGHVRRKNKSWKDVAKDGCIDFMICAPTNSTTWFATSKKSVADPGFPRGGGANSPGGANIRFCQIFPKTAWNWKKLGPEGRAPPLDPPLEIKKPSGLWLFNENLWDLDLNRKGRAISTWPLPVSVGWVTTMQTVKVIPNFHTQAMQW